jgi:hypothetical protein
VIPAKLTAMMRPAIVITLAVFSTERQMEARSDQPWQKNGLDNSMSLRGERWGNAEWRLITVTAYHADHMQTSEMTVSPQKVKLAILLN